jgi:hypothetical protein
VCERERMYETRIVEGQEKKGVKKGDEDAKRMKG